jgi:hypothetical protein
LFFQGLIRELLLQFGFQLRCDQFKQIRIVRYETLVYVLDAEEHLIVPRPEFLLDTRNAPHKAGGLLQGASIPRARD